MEMRPEWSLIPRKYYIVSLVDSQGWMSVIMGGNRYLQAARTSALPPYYQTAKFSKASKAHIVVIDYKSKFWPWARISRADCIDPFKLRPVQVANIWFVANYFSTSPIPIGNCVINYWIWPTTVSWRRHLLLTLRLRTFLVTLSL